MQKIRVGIFPGDIDTATITSVPENIELLYIVTANSVESNWVRQFIDPKYILEYQTKTNASLFSMELEELIKDSNLTDLLKKNAIAFLLINDQYSEFLETWSKENHIKIIATSFEDKKNFENKFWFHKLLQENLLPQPQGSVIELNTFLFTKPIVIQENISSGSEGTFIIKKAADLEKLITVGTVRNDKEYLIREYIAGKTYGITLFISPEKIALSQIRVQCFNRTKNAIKKFNGIQWIPQTELSGTLIKKINEVFHHLADLLYTKSFFGFANIDFIVDNNDDIFIIECNPRFSSATAQMNAFPETISDLKVLELFIENYFNSSLKSKNIFYSYPKSDFAGSCLYIDVEKSKAIINRQFNIGVYQIKNDKIEFCTFDTRKINQYKDGFIFYSEAMVDEEYEKDDTIGIILSNNPVFDFNGTINQTGKKLLEYFKLTI